MKGFAAALVGAGAGLGQGMSEIGNKYLDDAILRNRQQAFLDMQRVSNVQQAKDLDAYQNDPSRRENLRALKGQDDAASAASALAADKARLGDKDYQALALENQRGQARVAGEVAAEQMLANGGDKKYLAAVKALTAAQHFTGPGEDLARFQLQQHKQIAEIRTQLANEQDPAKREELQRREAALTGNTRSDKELSLALAQTVTAMERANKVLADPMADAEAKDSARESIAALKASAAHLSRKLGIQPEQKPVAPTSGAPWTKFQTGKPRQDSAAPAGGAAGAPAAAASAAGSGGGGEPGVISRVGQWLSETGRDYDTEDGKAELRSRIKESQNGGPALTRVERLRATQLGLLKA